MQYKATVSVTLRPSILDPQGKAIQHALHNLGFENIDRVRVGKLVELWIDAETEAEAKEATTGACRRLLANAVMEDFEIVLEAAVETD